MSQKTSILFLDNSREIVDMAAPRSPALLYRHLLKELKRVYKDKADSSSQVFVKDQFRKFQVTSEQVCRGKNDVEHTAATYLCLLQSSRQYEELHKIYHKKDRSIEASANLVGLKLPQNYNPETQSTN